MVVPVTRRSPRWLAAATALMVLVLALGGVMRERCIAPGDDGCCPPPGSLAFVGEDPCCSDCMAPAGPESVPSDVAVRTGSPEPGFVALSFAAFTLDAPSDDAPIRMAGAFRSDPVPLTLRNRVLRI